KDGEVFAELVDLYGGGDDGRLGQVVMKLSDFLGSVVGPVQWCEKARKWMETVGGRPSKQMLRAYGELLIEKFEQRRILCEHNAQKIRQLAELEEVKGLGIDELAMVVRFAQLLEGRVEGWARLGEETRRGEFDKLAGGIEELIVKRVPRRPKTDNEIAATAIEEIKDLFREASPTLSEEKLLELVGASLEQQGKALEQSGPYGRMILELAERLGAKYEQAKQRENRLDFGDLERKCFELLNDGQAEELVPSVVAKELQDRYRYVLVDEYQDINPLQNAILLLVSRELSPEKQDNLFAVGDVKQSIYRFRLAEPGIFTARLGRADEDGGGVIDLQSNFRCRAGLIKAVNLLFERLMDAQLGGVAYDDHARLRLGQKGYAELDGAGGRTLAGPAVEVHFLSQQRKGEKADGEEEHELEEAETEASEAELQQVQQEAVLVGKRIRHLMGLDESAQRAEVMDKDSATGQMSLRPIEYRDIAVLLRVTSRHAQSFARVLWQMDIPVYSDAETGYFATTEIQDVLALLEILDNPLQDIPLAAVLRS
ncbi:MAG: UvrD-helicase domain-containing protein, partial [Phycisphaerae bacterium]|nr:UvrD-helicase domain-containing protein [Phycisphaerae bacterium]